MQTKNISTRNSLTKSSGDYEKIFSRSKQKKIFTLNGDKKIYLADRTQELNKLKFNFKSNLFYKTLKSVPCQIN